jgi:CRP/FNR family cyclic AMP-dependent transcriptional regulator
MGLVATSVAPPRLSWRRFMSPDDKGSASPPMLTRFSGDSGRALLLEVLSDTSLLRGIADLGAFVDACSMFDVVAGAEVIQQGGSDNDLYIVLSGSLDVLVNGRRVATRRVGAHVGEMALVDSTARRSATVIAAENCLLLKCSEQFFSEAAQKQPKLWRRIAVELSRRLHERNALIRAPRTEPVLFVACSTEALEVAREIQAAFAYDPVVVEIWTDGVFNASKTPIEDLTALVGRIDFAIIIATPDDKIASRHETSFGPRDNVVFELGLAIGAIGRQRTLLVVPRGHDMKLPSDLLGVKPLDYADGDATTIKSRLGPLCTEIRRIVNRIGPL